MWRAALRAAPRLAAAAAVAVPAAAAPAPAAPAAGAPAAPAAPPPSAAARVAACAAAARALGPRAAHVDYGAVSADGRDARALACGHALAPAARPPAPRGASLEADFEALVRGVQDEVAAAVEALEGPGGARFREDVWARAEGGGGRSRVLQGGRVFAKAGVNVSVVHGVLPPAAAAQMRARPGRAPGALGAPGAPLPFYAAGVSLVLHPAAPLAPTAHANYRLFVVSPPAAPGEAPRRVWWFGGGADLTPTYVLPEDAAHFHAVHAAACARAHPAAYARFKAWADDYFAIPHRGGERRGVGGLFFDDVDEGALFAGGAAADAPAAGADAAAAAGDPYAVLPFVADAARSFLHAYAPLVEARHDDAAAAAPPGGREKRWQALRRGRYVEFNLVHDRGTKFGLATPGARIESILMSLPLEARWEYMAEPEAGSPEAATMAVLRDPVEWVAAGGARAG